MQPQAALIGRLKIDVDSLLASAKKLLGRSLSRKLDQQGKPTDTTAGYLAILSAMRHEDIDPAAVLEDPGHLLAHAYYTFLVACDRATMANLAEQTRLAIQKVESRDVCFAVVSGNLEDWQTSILNCCSEQSDYNLRLLFDKILLLFEAEGLGKVWARFTKKTLPDQTFKLIERK